MYLTIELENADDETSFVLIYKNWRHNKSTYTRLIVRLEGIPRYQALAMKKAVNTTATDNTKFIAKDNVTYIRRDCQLENM